MKLERLQLDKFQDKALKKEQMFKLNGGKDTLTSGGSSCETDSFCRVWEFDYGYDAIRNNGTSFHNRKNRHLFIVPDHCSGGTAAVGNITYFFEKACLFSRKTFVLIMMK